MTGQKAEFKVSGKELLDKIKKLMHEGNIRRIIIKDEEGNVFMDIPVTIGVIGVALLPIFAAVGALASLINNFTIEVIKKDDKDIEI